LTDPQDVKGLPETLLQLTAEAAAADDDEKLQEGSRLTELVFKPYCTFTIVTPVGNSHFIVIQSCRLSG